MDQKLNDQQISDLFNQYGQGMNPLDFIKLVKTIEMIIRGELNV